MAEIREFLSIPEAAALLGVSRIAVFKKVKKGQLAAIRIGRNWAIAASALQNPAPLPLFRPASAPVSPKPPVPIPPKAAAPLSPKTTKRKSAAASRPVPVFKPVPEKDSLDEMGWD